MKYTIIGAGIGGLTTALAFENKGIDYQVFERAPKLNEVGAGIWLAPNALQVLDSLSILDKIFNQGNQIKQITIAKKDLSPISDSNQQFVEDNFGYSTVAIHRAELQQILFDKIPKHKIHLGKSFNSFIKLNSKELEINFEEGSTVTTNFLIGADGIHSKVRKQLFPESTLRYSGQTCWRGVCEIDLDVTHQHQGFEIWGDEIRFGISKVAKNKVYWFAVIKSKPNIKGSNVQTKENLLKLFSSFHPIVTKLISNTELNQIIKGDINDLKPLNKWYKGNVCLLGDAAHATTPNMGQGGAQAIEDAYYLANLIDEFPDKNIFENFYKSRRRKVAYVVNQSWSMGKMAHWKYGQSIRNFIVKNIPSAYLEKQMLKLYRLK